ncbi:hypothetical protein GCM10012278_13170 [Nonomuraea glycinis]|uniref:Uncharacterized protein n=1 Tax=Nonomuraea glycinis TaxID=2047744 RepID=A0A918A2E2_9ACTN|nr:hypothetical protein GCM10012278_13170 [Nonomuraea glycinis]
MAPGPSGIPEFMGFHAFVRGWDFGKPTPSDVGPTPALLLAPHEAVALPTSIPPQTG